MRTPKVKFGPPDNGRAAREAATGPQGPDPPAAEARALWSSASGDGAEPVAVERWPLAGVIPGAIRPAAPDSRRIPTSRKGPVVPSPRRSRVVREAPTVRTERA